MHTQCTVLSCFTFFLVVLVYFLFRVVSCFTSFVFIFIEGERAHAESGHVGCDAGGLRPTGRYIDYKPVVLVSGIESGIAIL